MTSDEYLHSLCPNTDDRTVHQIGFFYARNIIIFYIIIRPWSFRTLVWWIDCGLKSVRTGLEALWAHGKRFIYIFLV